MARKNRTQFIQNSSQAADTLAASYRATIATLEAGEQTAEVAAQLSMARRLLAIAER